MPLYNPPGSGGGSVDLSTPGPIGGSTPSSGVFTTVTATSYNGNTFTTGTGTLTIAASKTLTVSNNITLTDDGGTRTLNIAAGGTLGTAAFLNTATGGNGSGDNGKVVIFGSSGTVSATQFISVKGLGGNGGNLYLWDVTNTNRAELSLGTSTLSGNVILQLPTVSGTFATLAGTEALTNKTYEGNTFTTGTGTLTIAAGKTLTANNSLTLAGTNNTTQTFPTTNAIIARTDAAQTFFGTQTFGALVATTINGSTITTGSGSLVIADGKTFTASNSITLAGTDGVTVTCPASNATMARTDAAQTFTGAQTFLTPIVVGSGGLGVATLTAYAPLFGGTTSTGAIQSGTVGTAGQVLTSNGAGILPSFQTVGASAAGTLTGTTLASNVVTSSLTAVGTIATGTWQGTIIGPTFLGTGSSISTKYLRGDGTWQTISGGGDALTSGNLSQFAATTSAQLAGVISDETGFSTGALAVFSKSPVIETPTIASFINSTHNHQNAAGGGTLSESALALTDVTTANVSTSAHGFAPKAPNDATKYLDGTGAYTVPAGSGGASVANPSGLIGMTAVNGSASTALRSDGHCAIDPAIAPTWTGAHIFNTTAPQITLGANTTTLGAVKLFGNTSGDATIQPAAVAGTATVVTLPNASSTLPIFGQQITFTGPTAARSYILPDQADTLAALGKAQTFTAAQTISTAGATSTSAVLLSGAVSATTNAVPYYLIQPSAASAGTNWTGNGTFFGINTASGFTGNFLDFKVNGAAASACFINSSGNFGTNGAIYVGPNTSFSTFGWAAGSSSMSCKSSWILLWAASSSDASGTKDTGMARNAAGVVEVNNGTAGTLRDITLRNATASGTLAVTGATTLTGVVTLGDTGTATASAGSTTATATLNKQKGTVTTDTLTTAAGASYTLTLTNSAVATTSQVMVSIANGTNTTTGITYTVTPGNGSVVIALYNNMTVTALNGTLKISFVVF